MKVANRTREHDAVIKDLIVERGMSYAKAIQWCERRAEQVARPYLAAADELRGQLASSPTEGASNAD